MSVLATLPGNYEITHETLRVLANNAPEAIEMEFAPGDPDENRADRLTIEPHAVSFYAISLQAVPALLTEVNTLKGERDGMEIRAVRAEADLAEALRTIDEMIRKYEAEHKE